MIPNTSRHERGPRIAIVHDWLTAFGGAERVLVELCRLLPHAEVFTLFGRHAGLRQLLGQHRVQASYLAQLPKIDSIYRWLAPLMPKAIESFQFQGYDLVISSSWAFAHGIRTPNAIPHLAYIHSPMRWAWDMQEEYLGRARLSGPVRWIAEQGLTQLRQWDQRAAQREKMIIANSRFIEQRIDCCWQRQSRVIYPPVRLAEIGGPIQSHGAYISVSRLVKYKRVDLWVEAFRHLPQHQLIVVGTGPELGRLQQIAPPNVRFTGWVSDEAAIELIAGAKGFLQASKEDFGISAVEAQGYGIPVLAYGQGGAAETVLGQEHAGPTGLLFDELEAEAVAQRILEFKRHHFRPEDCRRNAARFSPQAFEAAIAEQLKPFGIHLGVRSF